jgi:hypothetical protein
MKKMKVWKGAERRGDDYDTVARKVLGLEHHWDHADKDYNFESGLENTIREGLLLIGKLKPMAASLPEFWFRWDEKDRHLNVDIHGVDKKAEESFRNGQNGYSGHNPKRAPGGKKEETFEVDIWMPGKHVLHGVLRFRVARDMAIKMDSADVGLTFYDLK